MTISECREFVLKYQLSDWTFFGLALPMQMESVKLADQRPPAEKLEPPAEPLAAGSQGFVIRALPVSGPLPPLSTCGDYLCYVQIQYRHCLIDFQSSFAEYQKKFSSKTRSTINRKIKKYAEYCGGALSWKTYRTVAEMREFLPLAREVAKKTYQEKLLDAGIPDDEKFVRLMESLAAENRVRAYVLFDRERPVSYLYCPVEESVLLYAYLGYDPEYMKWSVGTILQWLAVEQLFDEGCFRFFDFTEGASEHKRLFATHEMQCANVVFLRNTPRNRVLAYSHWLTGRFSGWLGDVLEKFGVKAKVKKILRFSR